MKPVHSPRSLIIWLIVVLLAVPLLATFRPLPSAAAVASPPTPTATLAQAASTEQAPTPTPTPDPVLRQQSHATDPIIALGIIIVAVVIFGVLWGGRRATGKHTQDKS